MPDFSIGGPYWAQGVFPIAGIDEAGRGPWAGPVVAAAAILDPAQTPAGLNDSKKLSAKRREALWADLRTVADIGIGIASEAEIDELNILRATFLAMDRAVRQLKTPPAFALVDGNRVPDLPCAAAAIIKGDGLSLSIAAASIAAKVTRDRIMADLARRYPEYGWEHNAGYGTEAHQTALARFGVTPHHRKTFAPIAKILSLS